MRQGQSITVDMTLSVGTLAESVTVKGESPVVDTRSVGLEGEHRQRAARDYAWRARHLEHRRVQGAGRRRRVSRRRRQPGRPAAQPVSARDAERPEHSGSERRERERSGRAGVRDVLLRADDDRQHPGVDRRAGHCGRHRRRLHQHGDQERDESLQRHGPPDLPGHGTQSTQRRPGSPPSRSAARCELDRAADQHQLPGWRSAPPEQALLLRLRQSPGRRTSRCRASRLSCRPTSSRRWSARAIRTRPTSSPARARSRISWTAATASRASCRSSATTSRTATPEPP